MSPVFFIFAIFVTMAYSEDTVQINDGVDILSVYDYVAEKVIEKLSKETNQSDEGEVVISCRQNYRECKEMSTSFKEKMKCFGQFIKCGASKLSKHVEKCTPELVACKKEAGGSWRKHYACGKQYVSCLKHGN